MLPLLGYCEWCCFEHSCNTFLRGHISLGCIPKMELLGHMITMFDIWRDCQTVFYRSCTILHCHQQCMLVPTSPYSYQYLLLSVFHSLGVLVDVSCYLLVVFISISLMTSHVEHFFMCLLAIFISLEKYSASLSNFQLHCKGSLCILM